jgi:branched-chain amino acid transport system permease protein
MFLQGLLNGLSSGWIYVLVALGLTLVFGIMRVVQLAHGEMYMLGAHVVYYANVVMGINVFLSFGISVMVLALVGIILERYIFRPFSGRIEPSIIAAIGLILLMQTGAVIVFGGSEKHIPRLIPGIFSLWGLRLPWDRVLVVVLGVLFMGILAVFIKGTKTGQAIIAISQDSEAAALQGINIHRISSICMAVGCALAAVAGGLMGSLFSVDPFMGSFAISKGLAVIILGGLGSITGAITGGMVLGLIDGIIPIYYSATMADIIGFSFIILILIIRPTGLMGRG